MPYTVLKATPWSDLEYPPEAALVVREAKVGATQIGGIMSWDDAIATLRENNEGQRHEAINALPFYIMREQPDLTLKEVVEECSQLILQHQIDDPVRAKQLSEISYKEDTKDSELVRSVRPLFEDEKKRKKAVGELGSDRLAALGKVIEFPKETFVDIPAENFSPPEPLKVPEGGLFKSFDIHSMEPMPTPVVGGLLNQGDISAIIGLSNVGKTNLSALMMAAMVSGRSDIIGMNITEPKVTAWLNAEEDRGALEHRLAAVRQEHSVEIEKPILIAGKQQLMSAEDDFLSLVVSTANGPEINDDLVKLYIEQLGDLGVEFLNIEPITEFHGGNENAREDARLLYRAISQIIGAIDATALYWAHTVSPGDKSPDWYKGDVYSMRGSGQMAGNASASATITPVVQGKNAAAKMQSWNEARQGLRRNVIELTMAKSARLGRGSSNLFYELRSSQYDERVPVAALFDERDVASLSNDKAEKAVGTANLKQVIADNFEHGDKLTQPAMRKATGDSNLRLDRDPFKSVESELKSWRKVGNVKLQIVNRDGTRYLNKKA